ncbi:MAG TPA: serine/threonine-protein kinase [Kofleriaceae bacterium]|nr:serine/threonine-protein kinase [Kofleriaceae bacterium]
MLWVAALVIAGCADAGALELPQWEVSGPGPAASVTLPAHLALPDTPGPYTLRTTVALPAAMRGHRLRLVIDELPALVALRAGGAEIQRDIPAGTRYRSRGPIEWVLPEQLTSGPTLELALRVEHRWTQSAWWDVVPELLPADAAAARTTAVTVFDLYIAFAALIGLAQLALTGIAIYLVDRRRKVYLWLALQGIAAAYFPAFVLGWTQPVLGVYDAPGLAIALIVAITASVWFTHALLEFPPPSKRWLAFAGVGIVVAVVIHDPFRATQLAGPVTLGILGVLFAYQLGVTARAAARHTDRWMARFLLVSWLVLAGTMPSEVVHWLGLGSLAHGATLPSLGLLVFAVGLSLQLGRRHVVALEREADQRAVADDRLQAFVLLNQELRRQIADRSTLLTRLARATERTEGGVELDAGERIQTRYEIVRELGRGGMGIVYEVVRLSDRRRLAMKVTHEHGGISLARLAREALVASRVDHPNVVGVVDVDVSGSGVLYVVMELVDGKSLGALDAHFTDRAWTFDVLGQLASGLAALHAAGVVHRDIKPANVLVVDRDGRPHVKITDFGVSRPLLRAGSESREVPTLDLSRDGLHQDDITTHEIEIDPHARAASVGVTQAGALVGTPRYMAPEVIRDSAMISTSVDVFAFGVIAWEVLAGRSPFERAPFHCMLADEALPPVPSLATHWEGRAEVVALVDRCLSYDPALRPSATELADLFGAVRAETG